MVFKYEPTRLTPSNVNYYFISDHKMGEYGEFAILGVCDYREKGIMKQEAKLVINRGDRETFHYIKILLLERIEQERKKERSAERRLMVELKGNIW